MVALYMEDHSLFPWKTVRDNITIGPLNQGIAKEKIKIITNTLLNDIGLLQFSEYYPSQISEGMKGRVGIARALANDPEVLLMDEPFASLDYLTRLTMQDFLLKLWKTKRLTILFVTHDIDEAIRLSTKIIVLSKYPASIKEVISIDNNKDSIKIKNKILELITKK